MSGIPAAHHSNEYLTVSDQIPSTNISSVSDQVCDDDTGAPYITAGSDQVPPPYITAASAQKPSPYITAVSDQISTVSHLLPRRGLQRGACYLLVARAADRIQRSGQTHRHRIVVIRHRRQEGASPVGQQSYCAKSRPWRNTATRGAWYHSPRYVLRSKTDAERRSLHGASCRSFWPCTATRTAGTAPSNCCIQTGARVVFGHTTTPTGCAAGRNIPCP